MAHETRLLSHKSKLFVAPAAPAPRMQSVIHHHAVVVVVTWLSVYMPAD